MTPTAPPTWRWRCVRTATDEAGNSTVCTFAVTVGGGECFRRGDVNSDSVVDITDGINTLVALFLGTITLNCRDAADFDDSGALDITDAVATFANLFLGAAAAPPPGSKECGPDPTADHLEACFYSGVCNP